MSQSLITQDNVESELVLYLIENNNRFIETYPHKQLKPRYKYAVTIQNQLIKEIMDNWSYFDESKVLQDINISVIDIYYMLKSLEINKYIPKRYHMKIKIVQELYYNHKEHYLTQIIIKPQLINILVNIEKNIKNLRYKNEIRAIIFLLKKMNQNNGINFDKYINNWIQKLKQEVNQK